MKRFLIALFICSVPFSAKATLLGDIYDLLFGGDSEVTVNALQENEEPQELYFDRNILVRIDSELREYIDLSDFEYMKEHGEGFYRAPSDGNRLGFYTPEKNIMALHDKLFSYEKANVQEVTHHEIQHQKDYINLKEKGVYDPQNTTLNAIAESFEGGIMEARAYIEGMEFLYNKKNALYEEMKKFKALKESSQSPSLFDLEHALTLLGKEKYEDEKTLAKIFEEEGFSLEILCQKLEEMYNQFEQTYEKEHRPAGVAFRKFMEENKEMDEDERIKKARRAAAIALLNSDWFKNAYINGYLDRDFEGYYISPEDIINALGEDYFTLEDFYSAYNFWKNVCNSGRTTNFEECQAFWSRYEAEYCSDLKKKWSTCARLYEVAMAEKNCKKCDTCSEHSGRRLSTEKDKKDYEKCCHNISYSPLTGLTKEEREIVKENEDLTKEDLINEDEKLIALQKEIDEYKERLKDLSNKDLSDHDRENRRDFFLSSIESTEKEIETRKKNLSRKKTREELLRDKFKKREDPFAGE